MNLLGLNSCPYTGPAASRDHSKVLTVAGRSPAVEYAGNEVRSPAISDLVERCELRINEDEVRSPIIEVDAEGEHLVGKRTARVEDAIHAPVLSPYRLNPTGAGVVMSQIQDITPQPTKELA